MDELKGALLFEDRCYPVATDAAALDRMAVHLGHAALLAPMGSTLPRPARSGCAKCRLEILNGASACPRCGGAEALFVVDERGAHDLNQFDLDQVLNQWKSRSQGRSGPCGKCGKPLAFSDGKLDWCPDHAQEALSALLKADLAAFRKLLKQARARAKDDELEPWDYVTAAEAPAKLGSKWDEIENTYALSLAAERRSRRLALFVTYPVAAIACSWVGAILGGVSKYLLRSASNLPFWIGVSAGALGGIVAMAFLRREKRRTVKKDMT